MQSSTKKDSRPRGRPRAYDPEEALARARDTFWRNGYTGTSLDDLSAATGMNRPSLYGAFGDKHALYLQTMDRYVEAGRSAMDRALQGELPLRDALMRVFDGALGWYLPAHDAARGCLLIGTAAVGLRTYWHNRVGLSRPDGAPPADHESRNLDDLVLWLEGLR